MAYGAHDRSCAAPQDTWTQQAAAVRTSIEYQYQDTKHAASTPHACYQLPNMEASAHQVTQPSKKDHSARLFSGASMADMQASNSTKTLKY